MNFSKGILFFYLFCSTSLTVVAQSNSPSFDYTFLEVATINDFYSLRQPSDRYFTSGKTIRLQDPFLQKLSFGLQHFFPFSKNDAVEQVYEIRLDHQMYTPYRIEWKDPAIFDRPYAGLVQLGLSNESVDPEKGIRFFKEIQLGWVGPSVKGENLQNWFHRLKGRPEAQGWDYQIKDQLIAGISSALEKALLGNPRQQHLLIGKADFKLNTLQRDAQLHLEYQMGNTQAYFSALPTFPKQLTWTAYFRLGSRIVFANELLTGELRPNDYSESFHEIDLNSILLVGEYGLKLRKGYWNLRLSQSIISPEFAEGTTHFWGEIALAYCWAKHKKLSLEN